MKIIKTLGCISGLALLAACQSTTASKPDPSVETTLTPVSEAKPEAKAEVKTEQSAERVSYAPPPVGTRMVWKDVKGELSPFSVVSHESEVNGQKAVKFSNKLGFTYLRRSDGNRIARADKKERITSSFTPHTGFLNFPLFVGKKWSHRYSFQNKRGAGSRNFSFNAEVEAWEELKMPFGTIRTLRIRRNWSFGGGTSTSWFAPGLGVTVKDTYSNRTRNRGGELISYKRP